MQVGLIFSFFLFSLSLIFIVLPAAPCPSKNRFVAIGDWGTGTEDQHNVAAALSRWCQEKGCQFVVGMGDNIYKNGVDTIDDPRFETIWRQVYDLPGLSHLTWYQVLGNHDHRRCARCQVEYSKIEPRWYMPDIYYDKVVNIGGAELHLVFIDTTSIIDRHDGYEKQLQWLSSTLKSSRSTWKIVVGHHPPFSAGRHFPGERAILEEVLPLLEKFGVDIFLMGHDHNFQHIKRIPSANDKGVDHIDHVIAGAGGMTKRPYTNQSREYLREKGYNLEFFLETYGFVDIQITDRSLVVTYVDRITGRPANQFEKTKRLSFITSLSLLYCSESPEAGFMEASQINC